MKKDELIERLESCAYKDPRYDNIDDEDGTYGEHEATIAIRAINQYAAAMERYQQIATLSRSIDLSPADTALMTEPYNPEF